MNFKYFIDELSACLLKKSFDAEHEQILRLEYVAMNAKKYHRSSARKKDNKRIFLQHPLNKRKLVACRIDISIHQPTTKMFATQETMASLTFILLLLLVSQYS